MHAGWQGSIAIEIILNMTRSVFDHSHILTMQGTSLQDSSDVNVWLPFSSLERRCDLDVAQAYGDPLWSMEHH